MAASESLPEPDEAAMAHSRALKELLKRRTARAPLSFRDYMHAALYEPGYGYYVAGVEKFGERGDFITAPELTPLFGQTLAREVNQFLKNCPGDVLEFGAGAGGLAASLIPELTDTSRKYFIVEPSAELRQRQEQRLQQALSPAQFAQVSWLTTLPETFSGVMLANEVLDAFAVERFRLSPDRTEPAVEQLLVDVHDDRIEEHWTVASPELTTAVAHIQNDLNTTLPAGYQSELNLDLSPWFNALADTLNRGVILIIDYGYPRREYFSEERSNGTLSCYYQHRAHDDPYWYPGIQDLTAHVDFTAVIEAADAAGFSLLGYTNQTAFLMANGLTELAEQAMQTSASEMDRLMIAKAIKTLTLPGEMGERFQVMALGKSVQAELHGFASLDLSHRL